MMYTFGDARDTNEEAAELIESIVRVYTADILRKANANAVRRGARMTVDDVIFQIRRDAPKLNRLKEYLSWREIRKGLKSQTEKPTDDPSAAVDAKGALPCALCLVLSRVPLWWIIVVICPRLSERHRRRGTATTPASAQGAPTLGQPHHAEAPYATRFYSARIVH